MYQKLQAYTKGKGFKSVNTYKMDDEKMDYWNNLKKTGTFIYLWKLYCHKILREIKHYTILKQEVTILGLEQNVVLMNIIYLKRTH